ncbi:UNVERIFIED_CONTAM: Transposon Ty2-GR1 Gag-Pol polyprotein [Sesamum radiatum]|uniref:Transposon Ty2-GR1 Gag-Pol polyprotein n=1 Tax=Sesamum radiatum TaxID=300843 RepID=A0AAW2THM9_SESRA
MLRMKEVYAVPDLHIRYATRKAFFETKMAEGSFVQSHGVNMLFLVEKLEDLKVGLENDTYIDVILQSLPPSYDSFIVNYNLNGLEKSIHEIINMLVQYEVMTHKSEAAVLVVEASTSKAKGKGAKRWKRNKGKRIEVTATASTRGASPAAPKGKSKGKVGGSQRLKANDVCMHCQEKEHWKRECPQLLSNPGMFVVEVNMISNSASWVLDTGCGAHICNNLQVLEISRKLCKDEMILRLGDGNVVAAEAVGSLSLVIWHARLGHISKDRLRRLVDSKSFEIDNLDHLPTCESCLKEKMTKKPFVGQCAIANGLLDLVHTDVCAPLSIPVRGGFSYFITFTDDHSRYGYIYLMRYKSKTFERFKEYRLQWTPPGMAQLNGVVERRNRTLLDMVRSMMSFTELPPSFWGYAHERATKLLNIAPSKSVSKTPYEIWHGKPASYKYLRVWGSPAYVKRLVEDKLDSRSSLCRRDEVLIEKSSEEPHHDSTISFEPTVHTDGVPTLCRSTREFRVPERLVGKGYTQRLGVNFEETYSPVAMAKSIRIMLVIEAWYDYEIWQMNVKTAFLNAFVEKEIFMDQTKGFTAVEEEQMICRLQSGSSVAYLVLYADAILLIGNDVKMLGDIKAWLSTQFSMKDMGEVAYILGIKIYRDRSRRMLRLLDIHPYFVFVEFVVPQNFSWEDSSWTRTLLIQCL